MEQNMFTALYIIRSNPAMLVFSSNFVTILVQLVFWGFIGTIPPRADFFPLQMFKRNIVSNLS
jgi:hypothetical protein